MTTDQALDAILAVELARTLADLGIRDADALPPAPPVAGQPGIPKVWQQWARLHGWLGAS